MFQLQSSHHQTVYVRNIKENHISLPAVYIEVNMISTRHLAVTYKGMLLLHINKHLQYTNYCIKLNNSVT